VANYDCLVGVNRFAAFRDLSNDCNNDVITPQLKKQKCSSNTTVQESEILSTDTIVVQPASLTADTIIVQPENVGKLNMSKYGGKQCAELTYFEHYLDLSEFVQDIHYNMGKRIVGLKGGGSTSRFWKCQDGKYSCKIIIYRKKGITNKRLKEVPPNW
jgi:hypothetical protein